MAALALAALLDSFTYTYDANGNRTNCSHEILRFLILESNCKSLLIHALTTLTQLVYQLIFDFGLFKKITSFMH